MASTDELFNLYDGTVKGKFQIKRHWYYVKGTGLLVPDDGKFHYTPNVTTIAGKLDKSFSLIPWAVKCGVNKFSDSVWKLLKGINPNELAEASTAADLKKLIDAKALKKVKELGYNANKVIQKEGMRIGTAFHAWYEQYSLYIMGNVKKEPVYDWKEHGKKNLMKACDRIKKFIDDNTDVILSTEEKVYSKKWHYIGTLDQTFRSKYGDKEVVLNDLKVTSGVYPATRMQLAAYYKAKEEMGSECQHRMVTLVDKSSGHVQFINLSRKFPTSVDDDFNAFIGLRQAYLWQKQA